MGTVVGIQHTYYYNCFNDSFVWLDNDINNNNDDEYWNGSREWRYCISVHYSWYQLNSCMRTVDDVTWASSIDQHSSFRLVDHQLTWITLDRIMISMCKFDRCLVSTRWTAALMMTAEMMQTTVMKIDVMKKLIGVIEMWVKSTFGVDIDAEWQILPPWSIIE
jgi:hypothetical protein